MSLNEALACACCGLEVKDWVYHTFGYNEQVAICCFCYKARKDYNDEE